jgi:hypothetical protein
MKEEGDVKQTKEPSSVTALLGESEIAGQPTSDLKTDTTPLPPMKEEKEEARVISPTPPSSVSLNYLLEAYGTMSPSEKMLVDIRDSLEFQMKTNVSGMKKRDRKHLISCTVYWVAHGGVHLVSRRECVDGLRHLSPYNICYSSEGVVCISESYSGEGESSMEWKRWAAPEISRGEVFEGTEKSVAYTLGLCMYSVLMGEIPFSHLSAESAGRFCGGGARPEVEGVSKEYPGWEDLIERCWREDVVKRMGLKELSVEIVEWAPRGIEVDDGNGGKVLIGKRSSSVSGEEKKRIGERGEEEGEKKERGEKEKEVKE